MKTLIALLLLCAGVWLIHSGWDKRASLSGKAQVAVARIGHAIDGEARLPAHVWYFSGGTVLGLAGLGLLFAGGKGR